MLPIIEQLARDLGDKIRVAKVDIDTAKATAAKFGISSIPSFAIIKEGTVVQRFSGVVGKDRLASAVSAFLD